MDPLRIAIVTSRFWPLLGGEEAIAGHLAAGLAEAGAEVTVVTVRWQDGWPERMVYRGAHVVRLARKPQGTLQKLLYWRQLTAWLYQRRAQFDAIYAFGLRLEAAAALMASRGKPAVVVRVDRAGQRGDVARLEHGWLGRWIRRQARRAAWFVAPSAEVENELVSAGFSASRMRRLPNGVPLLPPRSPERRRTARAVLAATQIAFELPDAAPLVVYCGRLTRDRGLSGLVAAFPQVIERCSSARLWLVGDGPEYLALQKQINEVGLSGRILLSGAFEGVEEVLAAADVACFPSSTPDSGMAILEAMSAGLPLVVADTPPRREMLRPNVEGLLVPPGDSRALASAMGLLLHDATRSAAIGNAARRRAEADFSLAQMVAGHVTWLDDIRCGRPAPA